MVWVNDFGYSFTTGQASWGGVKSSGFGRTSSKHGLYECVQVKYLDSDRGRLRPAWWFPYDAKTERALRAPLDVLYGERSPSAGARPGATAATLRHIVKRSRPMSELSHVDESGAVRMVDVGAKPLSRRRAVAYAEVRMLAGDGAAAARPAEGRRARDGAARRDHGGEAHERADPALPSAAALAHRGRRWRCASDAVEITAVAETTAQTGVEMEALTAASVAALTVYDMCKAIDKAMTIAEVRLLEKTKEPV